MKGPADIAHGPMFIGFMFNILLYGIMMTQVYIYFTTYKRDKPWMKLFVILLLVLDTANSIFDFIYLYQSLIKHFGDDARLATANWLFATDPALTAVIASLVQGFFAWRIHVLTQSRTLVLLVAMGSVAGTIGGIITSWEVGRTPRFVDFQDFKSFVILWLVSEGITDIFVTTILVWHLHKTGYPASDLMVDRIIRITVQTGLITSLVATLDVVFFLVDATGTHLIFNFPLCKLYTNSLMSSLNSRRGWKFGASYVDSRRTQTGTGTDLGVYTSSHHNTPASNLNEPRLVCDLSSVDYDSKDLEQGCYIQKVKPSLPLKNSRTRFLPSIKQPPSVLRLKHSTRPEVFVHVESHQSSPDRMISTGSRMASPVRSLEAHRDFEQGKPRALSECTSVYSAIVSDEPAPDARKGDTNSHSKALSSSSIDEIQTPAELEERRSTRI